MECHPIPSIPWYHKLVVSTGYNRTLGELGSLSDPIRELQRTNLRGCLIEIVYRTSQGEERILRSTFDEKSNYGTKVYTVNGDYCEVADVESTQEYPLRLFGWSEIETLGRSHRRQRELLDRLIPELNPLLEKRKEIKAELAINGKIIEKVISEVQAAFQVNDKEIRRYVEFKKDFDKLNTGDVKILFAALDIENEKRALLLQVYDNAINLHKDLSGADRQWLTDTIENILENGSIALREWWVTEESNKLGIFDAESQLRQQLQAASEKAHQFANLIKAHGQELKAGIDKINTSLQKQFEENTSLQKVADLRANAESRLKRVEKLRKEYQDKWARLFEALTERSKITFQLATKQNEIAGMRARYNSRLEDALNKFLPDQMRVTISLKPGRDSENFAEWLQQTFGSRSNQVKRIRQVLKENVSPIEFADMIIDQNFDNLIKMSETMCGVSDGILIDDIDVLKNNTAIIEMDQSADVPVLADGGKKLARLLSLQETEWDDEEAILLNGIPVNEKSPGQRSSAMLPLIALAENTPLVIDQPEDNLDKRLIGTVLAGVLADLKEKRQIIVCTHDPNILVGGDAEQIIVLDAQSDRKGGVQKHGSIDNEDIIQTVVDLLEGGDEAFERREQRYKGRAS